MSPISNADMSAEGQDAEMSFNLDGDAVVISGMSGLFPKSRHVGDFKNILYNKIYPVTDDNLRWNYNHPEMVHFTGQVPGLDRFDAQFFKVHYHLGVNMDPMARKLLEQAHQAIYDAGVSPTHLYGRKVGVYIGTCFSETEKVFFYDSKSRTGFGIAGNSKTMYANRISYWLNAKGPSMAIDQACCSSLAALEQACLAIVRGECEAAIVGGANLCLHPHASVNYSRIVTLSPDGKIKAFDENASGCARSEAVGVLFLQKAKDALRVYAEVVKVKSEHVSLMDGETGPRYGFYRDPVKMTKFMNNFYQDARIKPHLVEYVEAFGSGILEVDKVELDSISNVYCKDRTEPLLVGSVASNMGYSEAASGIAAITKVLLGYQRGELAGNLHCERPRQDVSALREGRMQIVTQHRRFRRTYVAVNGISVTGVNAHVLLHGHYKPKELMRYSSCIPRLVLISGRHDGAVKSAIDNLKTRRIDPEEIALLLNIHQTRINGYLGRGYVILDQNDNNETISLDEKACYFDEAKRPLWFVYSGMGSQWAGMGEQLMRIPIFAAAIERCHKVLEPKGIDIVHIITSKEKTIFDNILHSFVGIAAVQIGLTDILLALGLVPDKIIGHSVGELGCAYADGCLTAEEMILSAYSRGLVSIQTSLIHGSMAAIGMGFQKISEICPKEIDVACHNGPDSCTISGPVEVMCNFVSELNAKGIFAKEVPCSNIAYHSRYIAEAGPGLLKYLSDIITTPKRRSERWVSTSVPKDRWNEPTAMYSSAEYHANNLLSPVLFEEVLNLVPNDAVLVEVAPHGLLQAILKRSLPSTCVNISLTRRGHSNNTLLLLQAIGRLYMTGYIPKVDVLYPKIDFPVSSETPVLSHLVDWAHDERWLLPFYSDIGKKRAAACKFVISIHDTEYKYLRSYVIRGKVLYSFTAALVAVWDTLAMTLNLKRKYVSVQFHDVYFYSQPVLHDQRQLKLSVSLHRGNGMFEVTDGESKVIAGYITSELSKDTKFNQDLGEPTDMEYSSEAIYRILSERDYSFGDDFRSIHCINPSLDEAQIIWNNNWVTFIDGLLQFNILNHEHDSVSKLAQVRRIIIDIEKHYELLSKANDSILNAKIYDIENYIRCGGVILEGIEFHKQVALDEDGLELKDLNIYLERNDGRPYTSSSGNNVRIVLQSDCIGNVDSLVWVQDSKILKPGVLVTVRFVGFNDLDVKKAYGIIETSENGYAMDYSGVTESGVRVMGIVRGGAASSVVRAEPALTWPVPAHWSLEDAATVPLPYALAFYCLGIKTKILSGMSILIQGGTGALGQAAIAIALASKLQVFTTVSDTNKKKLLCRLFPELNPNHIAYSRDHTFGDVIFKATKGKGCDIIINTVRGMLKNTSFKCCAPFGVTFDAVQENFSFGMSYLTAGRSYVSIDFSSSLNDFKNLDELRTVQTMMSEGIARGYVRPLSHVTYEQYEVSRAFRLLAAKRHCGRVLLRVSNTISTQHRFVCSPEQCHLIISDGELGLQLADRLVARGARKLYLHFLVSPPHLTFKLRSWKKVGVQIKISFGDIENKIHVMVLIKDSAMLGPVGGIYSIKSDFAEEKIKKAALTLSALDLTSRNLCPFLTYFAMVSFNTVIGQEVCRARAQSRLPVTMITLPEIKYTSHGNSLTNTKAVTCRHAVDAIERACSSSRPALVAIPRKPSKSSLFNQIACISDINTSPDKVEDSATLKDLGFNYSKLQIINNYLSDNHNISLDESEIPFLTKLKIQELEEMISERDFVEPEGLAKFFSYVDSDELLATIDIVHLPTLMHNASEQEQLDLNQTYLSIIPGLEGHHERFRILCEGLKLPAYVVQPGLDRLHETLPEMAQRYAEILLQKAKLKDNFYLLGYESGVLVALETAAILEKHGLTGKVFCVGYSPEEFQKLLEEKLKVFNSEEALQDAVIRHMYTLMTGHSADALNSKLNGALSWREKVSVSVRSLLGRVAHSAHYAGALIEAAYARMKQVREYKIEVQCLRSQLVVMQCSPASSCASLQRHSQHPLCVHHLRAPLSHAAADLRCAAIINQYLDKHLLEAYENKNLCETYLVDSISFMVRKL